MTTTNDNELIFYNIVQNTARPIPLVANSVSAGFPSPAESDIEGQVDLNSLLIKNPPATFMVRVAGDSMINAGIFPDCILIVDKSIEAKNKDIIIAILDNEFTVKRVFFEKDHIVLFPENKNYKPIIVTEENNFEVWGVVTNVIHKL